MSTRFRRTTAIVAFLTTALILSSASPISAAALAGQKCSKAGSTKTSSGIKYTCIKSGKKLVWSKGVKVFAPQPVKPAPVNSSTPSPAPTSNFITPGELCNSPGLSKKSAAGDDYTCSLGNTEKVDRWRPAMAPISPNNPGPLPSPQPSSGTLPNPQPSPSLAPAQPSSPGQGSSKKPYTEYSSTYSTLAPSSGTRITSSASPNGYLAAMGFSSTIGTSIYDHPSGLASDGRNLILVDRGNNRILVWNTAPTTSESAPDFVLCQPNQTSTVSGSALNQCNWPSDAIVTPTGKLLVADSDNNRILIWNTMPTATGASASFALDLGESAWPWGIWSDGTRVAATSTGRGRISIWNSFPTSSTQAPSFVIEGSESTCIGTPRGLMSNGTALLTGEHNGKCGETKGIHVFTTFPTSSSAKPTYMIVPPDPNYAWPMGTFDKSTGKAYLLSRTLQAFDGFPATKPVATQVAEKAEFDGGDGGDVEIVNGLMYVVEYNGNRVSVFKGIPTSSSLPDFYLGLSSSTITSPVENPLKKNFLITNPQVTTLDGAMAINSDFDRAIYVWKNIPATSGAKPDLVWSTQNQNDPNPLLAMDFQPDSSDTGKMGGKSYYAVAGEKSFVVWEGIPTSTSSVPILNIKDSIGNVNFDMHLRVAMDEYNFYILDGSAKKIYVWKGLPADKNDSPDFTLNAEANRIRSDGKHLVAASLYTSPHILVWDVATLKQGSTTLGTVGYQMNLPQDAFILNGALYVADTSFHRVLYWSSITAAMAGGAPDGTIGAGSSTSDIQPGQSDSEVRWPASIWVENGYLWVSERKFGHRVLRYKLD